jgi:hypothetical protein
MQVRVLNITRNGKHYSYAQLVESYRRESDGMPMHRIIRNLGPADSIEVHNLREALKAARRGKRVAATHVSAPLPCGPPRPSANLRCLDLAVLLELWREWKLDELVGSLIPHAEADVGPEAVVCALALQRCVDPGSKLYASRWFPRTALPELLGVAPESFNNSRLHRVLDDLDEAGPRLQSKLSRACVDRDGAFVSLFLDVSDAWFVGHGPDMAERGKTKEGMIQRKIGIVLLCSGRGYPVRWEVIPGNRADGNAMNDMLESIKGLSWAKDIPIVMDRAMGKTAHIAQMSAGGLWFVTALTTPEFEAYSDRIPHQRFAALEPKGSDHLKQDLAKARACALAAGMLQVQEDLFVQDLGIVERCESVTQPRLPQVADTQLAAEAMRKCRQFNEAVAGAQFSSLAAAGRAVGMGKGLRHKYGRLSGLAEQIQRDVLDGKASRCSIADLLKVAALEGPEQQREAFGQLLATRKLLPARRPHKPKTQPPGHADKPEESKSVRVHAVAYFNPDRFVEKRLCAQRWLRSIEQFAEELNARLQSPRSKLKRDGIAAAVDRKLRRYDLVEAFNVRIEEHRVGDRKRYRVDICLDAAAWATRRRYDGFTLLVTHPDLVLEPEKLCQLYRSKDAVEKDFQVIKSVVQLRPIRHHTDSKVRAHVTLCMLALLLERTLQHKLGSEATAAAAIESLATCHLNRYAAEGGSSAYVLTQPDAEQNRLLRALHLQHLADSEEIAERITPR